MDQIGGGDDGGHGEWPVVDALPDLDSLFDQFDSAVMDPWHRLSAIDEDLILLIEFSETEGPRPALCIPSLPNDHFDRDAFAVWLMTSDYQRMTCKDDGRCAGSGQQQASFQPSVNDVQVLMHNAEQGVFTFAQQFTLYELRARAFVRPFCLSYVSKDRRKLMDMIEDLQQDMDAELIRPLKTCNKRLFFNELQEALKILDVSENQAICSYYELCYTDGKQEATTEQRVKPEASLHSRNRRLHVDIHNAYKSLASDLANNPANTFACLEEHRESMDAWLRSLKLKTSGQASADSLPPLRFLSSLAPCAFVEFEKACRRTLHKYRYCSPSVPHHLVAHLPASSTVRLGSVPMLYYPNDSESASDQAGCTALPSVCQAVLQMRNNCSQGDDTQLAAFYRTPRLSSILYSVLIGKFILLTGSELRQRSVMSFVCALEKFVPTVHSNPSVQPWSRGRLSAAALADFKVFGMHTPKAKAELPVDLVLAPFVSVVDLNRDVLIAPEYRGTIMRRLADTARRHRSDWSFVAYLLATLADYFSLAYVLTAFLGDRSQCKNREPRRRMLQFGDRFRLDEHDLKIIRYLVDFVHVQIGGDQPGTDCGTLSFDSECPKVVRL